MNGHMVRVLAAGLFLCVVAVSGANALVYSHDDGTAENAIGISGGGTLWWASGFTVVPGGEVITSLEFYANEQCVGNTTLELRLYDDADNNGDPTAGLSLLRSVPVPAILATGWLSQSIPDTAVSGDFFVAAVIVQPNSLFLASLDQTSSAGQSWAAIGDDPSAAMQMDSIGFPGNWLLRATAGSDQELPVAEPAGLLFLGTGLLAMRGRRRT